MAIVMLKANLANRNIFVQSARLDTEMSSSAEVKIMPRNGWKIDAKDFTTGFLRPSIESMRFSNSGENVIASVNVNSRLINEATATIFLPISGIVRSTKHMVNITESIEKDNNIITRYTSTLSTSIVGNKITYRLEGKSGERSLLFKRTFILTGNYDFVNIPTYTISNNADRFNIITTPLKRDKKILGYEFEVFYKSPKEILDLEDVETIDFKATSFLKEEGKAIKKAVKKEEYKIYSFDPGKKIGAQGGFRVLKVTGVPGTEFNLLLQDSNKKTYNQKTGKYEAGGGMLKGVIPAAIGKAGYGVYIKKIRVPRATTAVSYEDRLIDNMPVDHSKIKSTRDANKAMAYDLNVLTGTKIAPESKVTISLDKTGSFTSDFEDVVYGPGDFKSNVDGDQNNLKTASFSFKAFPATGSSLTVSRQPLNDLTKDYVAWDSGDKADADTSAGVSILNDWSNSREVAGNTESSVDVLKCSCTQAADLSSSKCKVTVDSVTFGEGDNTYSLRLNNFLTQTAL